MPPRTKKQDLTVAVTGPTGTFGFGLMPQLQADARIKRIVGIARRPFDPLEHGWTKMEYRQGDVREPAALVEGEWFFAHERLPQIKAHLTDLGW